MSTIRHPLGWAAGPPLHGSASPRTAEADPIGPDGGPERAQLSQTDAEADADASAQDASLLRLVLCAAGATLLLALATSLV